MRATGRRVLETEAAALSALAGALDDSFDAAVARLLEAKGRVIVSGMGKSGHVARKIAATFASTGQPSQFVHPAEASHGDLGMVTAEDVVLMVSRSGETPELADLIAFTRRFGIGLIGVAERAGSTLLTRADIAIRLPEAPEACGTGIVPTTSTTMTMALGDALAIALMEHRRFTPEHFATFHPGGSLGAQLARVRDLMHPPPLIAPATPMPEALIEMTAYGFGVLAVGTAARLDGIVTDGDLRRHIDGLMARRVSEIMTPGPRTIGPEALASEALRMMEAGPRPITALLVAEGTAPVGILKVHDLLRAGVR